MKVVFQGAGAIGAAAAALFGRRHETVVVSRSANPGSEALNSPDTVRLQDTVRPQSSAPTRDTARPRDAAYPRRVGSTGRETVRRVPVVDWATVSSSSWDLVVLTTRPGDLDEPVAASISGIRPSIIAITSQVDGDRDIAVSMFPESEILVFSPALLSERTTGRNARYWQPPGMPVFMASGRRETVRGLRRGLGGGLIGGCSGRSALRSTGSIHSLRRGTECARGQLDRAENAPAEAHSGIRRGRTCRHRCADTDVGTRSRARPRRTGAVRTHRRRRVCGPTFRPP